MHTLDFPTLRQLFGAYLNRDWPDEYGTVDEAVSAFRAEIDAPRHQRALAELDKLMAAGLPDAQLAEFISELGCEYVFEEEPDAAAKFLGDIRKQLTANELPGL